MKSLEMLQSSLAHALDTVATMERHSQSQWDWPKDHKVETFDELHVHLKDALELIYRNAREHGVTL